jgi:hypothetical protein
MRYPLWAFEMPLLTGSDRPALPDLTSCLYIHFPDVRWTIVRTSGRVVELQCVGDVSARDCISTQTAFETHIPRLSGHDAIHGEADKFSSIFS